MQGGVCGDNQKGKQPAARGYPYSGSSEAHVAEVDWQGYAERIPGVNVGSILARRWRWDCAGVFAV